MSKRNGQFHATIELVDAMKGLQTYDDRGNGELADCTRPACGLTGYRTEDTIWAFPEGLTNSNRHEDLDGDVSCPTCLRLMFDAIEPVRRDYLLERGLIKELEPEV